MGNTVVFTKNLTKQNRDAGLRLVGQFYRSSAMSKYPSAGITTSSGFIKYLDDSRPTYIEFLGELSRQFYQDDVNKAVAKAVQGVPPDYHLSALALTKIFRDLKPVGTSTGEVVSQAASEIKDTVVETTGSILKWGSGILIVGGLAYLAFYLGAFSGLKGVLKK